MEGLTNNENKQPIIEYKPYDMNNPNNALILGQQNAGNIEFLKGRIKDVDGVNTRLDSLEQNMDSMQEQIDALVQQQASFANDINGGEPIDISDENENKP
jgi:septation ring formation regulator EzrA